MQGPVDFRQWSEDSFIYPLKSELTYEDMRFWERKVYEYYNGKAAQVPQVKKYLLTSLCYCMSSQWGAWFDIRVEEERYIDVFVQFTFEGLTKVVETEVKEG